MAGQGYRCRKNEGWFDKKINYNGITEVNLFSSGAVSRGGRTDFPERVKCRVANLAIITVRSTYISQVSRYLARYINSLLEALISAIILPFTRLVPVSHSLEDFVFVIIVFPRI